MNVWIASDIHGSALYCRKLLDLMEKRGADRLVLLPLRAVEPAVRAEVQGMVLSGTEEIKEA